MSKEKITITQIAELAFVSRSVVSRVLNNHPNVSAEARERVLEVIQKYDYHPSSTARSLATRRTYEICIVVPRWHNEVLASGFWSLIFLGIAEKCAERGYHGTLSAIATTDESLENKSVRQPHGADGDLILNHKYDGFVLMHDEVLERVYPIVHEMNLPAVAIGHPQQSLKINSIDIDNQKGAFLATQHLTQLGHKRIALVTEDSSRQESISRRAGYTQALELANITFNESLIISGRYSEKEGYLATQHLLNLPAPPTAIFYASDSMAHGGLLALYEAGLKVPDDMAVMGFDNLPASQFTIPPLSSIHQPVYQKGAEAATMLIDLIEKKRTGVTNINLPPELIVRRSCGGS